MRPERVLFLFVDGLGVGTTDPARNPLLAAHLPNMRELLRGHLPVEGEIEVARGRGAAVAAADATLGLEGLPQSGTGQTSLLTGENAARRFGRHFGPWVPTELREWLGATSLLAQAASAGRRVAFANATPPQQLGRTPRSWRRPAAPPLAAALAGAEMRGAEALRDGRAVASSITNERWREHVAPDVPEVDAGAAGAILARIARGAELTLFAHYDTDLVGHRGDHAAAVATLERLDRFLGGVLDALEPDTLLVIASDHGNVEDVAAEHTRNPVPVIAAGPGADTLARHVRSITDVARVLAHLMELETRDA